MTRVQRGTPAGDAYLDLQNQARRSGRVTQELLQLYVLEGFLARLAVSDIRESFVLKAGVLLAAFGSRRPTKDVDLAAQDVANWRDFGDIYTLAGQHPIAAGDLARAIAEVGGYRNATLRPLSEVLDDYAALGQQRWSRWRRTNGEHLPEQFAVVVDLVIAFADPVLTGAVTDGTWNPRTLAWSEAATIGS